MSDLQHQDLNVAQSNKQQFPPTIASAATIAPTTRFSFISGTAQLQNITPPSSGYHELVLCFITASPGLFLTTGNIQIAYQPIINRPITLHYDPAGGKYWVAAVV